MGISMACAGHPDQRHVVATNADDARNCGLVSPS
jgi:hypothetical protein